MLRIAVCDDEKHFRENIKELAAGYLSNAKIEYEIDTYSSGEEFLKEKENLTKYFAVFLDMEMPGVNGVETARKIRECNEEVQIVFVTAYLDYSPEGYTVGALRYLLKGNRMFEAYMEECMDELLKKVKYTEVVKAFSFDEAEKKIEIDNIIYIESTLHKLNVYVREEAMKKYSMTATLNALEEELQIYPFVRIHQSFLVNLKYIKKVSGYKVILHDGLELSVPKSRYKEVKKMFMTYKGGL